MTERLWEVGWGVASGVDRRREWVRGLKLKYIGVSGFWRILHASPQHYHISSSVLA